MSSRPTVQRLIASHLKYRGIPAAETIAFEITEALSHQGALVGESYSKFEEIPTAEAQTDPGAYAEKIGDWLLALAGETTDPKIKMILADKAQKMFSNAERKRRALEKITANKPATTTKASS